MRGFVKGKGLIHSNHPPKCLMKCLKYCTLHLQGSKTLKIFCKNTISQYQLHRIVKIFSMDFTLIEWHETFNSIDLVSKHFH